MADRIPQELVDERLARCARHCCVCRRRKPLQLQVHHIIPKAKGGTDDIDNLIAVCLTCHYDVHTQTYFTRRFTVDELKLGRDQVYEQVSKGILPYPEAPAGLPSIINQSLEAIFGPEKPGIAPGTLNLSETAVELLILAANSHNGIIMLLQAMDGTAVQIDHKDVLPDEQPRTVARYRDALDQLVTNALAEEMGTQGELFRITHRGYVLGDELMAAGGQSV